MIIFKENEIIMKNDIYFLKVVNDKIVVNNGYEGIFILNSNLNVIKKIHICHDFCVYNVIILNEDKILFNCIDNNIIFVVNIKTSEVKKCKIPALLANDVLMKKVDIQGDFVVFKTYKNHIILLDLKDMIFSDYDKISVSSKYEKNEKNIECIEYVKIGNSCVCMNEQETLVCNNNNNYKILPRVGYRFLKIDYINDKLIVLSSSNNNETSLIASYRIITSMFLKQKIYQNRAKLIFLDTLTQI